MKDKSDKETIVEVTDIATIVSKGFDVEIKVAEILSDDIAKLTNDSVIATLNMIPLVGGYAAQMAQSVMEFQQADFFRKFVVLLYGIQDLSTQEREKFGEEIEVAAKDNSGSILAGMISRIDNINKSLVLANLIKAKVDGKIDIDDFFRLSLAVERIPYTDFKYLKEFVSVNYLSGGVTELFFASGVLNLVFIDSKSNNYVLSSLGQKLVKYGLSIDLDFFNPLGTDVELSWTDLSDNSQSHNDDSAAFNYDLFRGK